MLKRPTGTADAVLRTCLLLGLVATVALAGACGDDEEPEDTGIGVRSIDPAATGGDVTLPVDATPSPDGKDIYFIAYPKRDGEDPGLSKTQLPAIYKTAASGGTPQKLHEGAPLGAPFGISISDDGATLFIADSAADSETDETSGGRLFQMPSAGGAPTVIAGTEGYNPGGVEHVAGTTYFTGKKDGAAGVFKVAGGAVSPVATGAQFVDPSGVAVSKKGEVYVVDSGNGGVGSPQALASVIKAAPGPVEVLRDGIRVGHPAGIALIPDETALLVSALDTGKGTDVVYRIELGDRSLKLFEKVIGDFTESAGLHRARNAGVFAWADSHAGGSGTVYVLKM
jgi:sugar lactone lactonase YvrE